MPFKFYFETNNRNMKSHASLLVISVSSHPTYVNFWDSLALGQFFQFRAWQVKSPDISTVNLPNIWEALWFTFNSLRLFSLHLVKSNLSRQFFFNFRNEQRNFTTRLSTMINRSWQTTVNYIRCALIRVLCIFDYPAGPIINSKSQTIVYDGGKW